MRERSSSVSPQRRADVLDALRRGTVPKRGLDLFAVGLDRFAVALGDELAAVKRGGAGFKAVRGEYGSGKTFFARWLQEEARRQGFAVSEVQVSETETPLHQLGTVYRRLIERLSTADTPSGAFRSVVDGWFFTLEQDVLAGGEVSESDAAGLLDRTNALMERRLSEISRRAPAFAAALRAYRKAQAEGSTPLAEGILAWLGGQPNVSAEVKRYALVKGEVDHFTAMGFLQGLLVVLRDSGYAGLLFCLDEVETLQRVRSDVRDKGLNALRQLVDELDAGVFPGLYVLMTGTPAFYEGPMGATRLPPLAQRLHVDFSGDPRFDNPRAVQLRLAGFSRPLLEEVGRRVRDLYADGATDPARIGAVSDEVVARLAAGVTGELGGKVGVAPRVFLKKLVAELLDRVDQFPDFDPGRDYSLTIAEAELTRQERSARAARDPDEIELEV
ncbi:BREX system ATP-binding protein BrxD [Acidobacteria bacterium ACD]|nr:MAG: BREX system ATP-binding protein BrxD [Acidobacteriota bacterium]MCE7957060.1 BREX system ATP-binding protein BrxD [Acidobacteria bacterium ACB2]MDL1950536.1 BREX system ATP-binding protein BrxD [Acidobacteria bacterium ACD]